MRNVTGQLASITIIKEDSWIRISRLLGQNLLTEVSQLKMLGCIPLLFANPPTLGISHETLFLDVVVVVHPISFSFETRW